MYPSRHELFKITKKHWSRLRQRFVHRFGPIQYIQTWEITQKGEPHCNVLISCQPLHAAVLDNHREVKWKWLEPAVVKWGFGRICYLEAMKSHTRMAGYLTKLAKELTGAGVKCQVPVSAPRHFRRLRASQGLLPPRYKDEESTGMIVKQPLKEKPCTVPTYGVEC